MRVQFPNLTRPKKGAKILSHFLNRPLSLCQSALARACGYKDWHELERQAELGCFTILDQDLSSDEYVLRQVDLVVYISRVLSVSDDDVQFAVARARITGDRKSTLVEQLAIRTGCLRSTSLPDLGRRQRGSVCRINSAGWRGQSVILKRFESPLRVITESSTDATVADFELVSPRQPLPLFVPMRLYLAYGVWTEKDGARVIFSRDYKPLWRLNADAKPIRVDPWDWIQFDREEWFWSDTSAPWSSKARYEAELERLEGFGVDGLPKLVETLPYLVLHDDLTSIGGAVERLQAKYASVRAA